MDEHALVVAEIAEFVRFDFVFLGFRNYVAPCGSVKREENQRAHFRKRITPFTLAGNAPVQWKRPYQETLQCIERTIKAGPVVYASGNMFRYENGRVVVDAGAWREFCQLGHWIEPAVRGGPYLLDHEAQKIR